MSDDDQSDDGESEQRRDRDERDRPDEPLGDLAAEVRKRTGNRRPADRHSEDRPSNDRLPIDSASTDSPESADGADRDGPLADVAAEVDERRREGTDEADAFESVEVGALDGEELWDRLAEAEDDADGPTVTVASDAADPTEPAADRDVRTIPKATCHGCPHFGDPPELACTHEGTEILAMPDTDHFRVADCPVVVEGEEDIGDITAGNADGGE
ncbi:hypothetical protein [Halorussus aquaticus]|uniref:DUF8135 domain-containing protein n=1 Tax=Halorussus aquaticus TaxID=2953748 RepID=A0ABD5Q550_9EURY|nr:hypothetical protein [Halorussus aquaticus]